MTRMFLPMADRCMEMKPADFEKYSLEILESHIKGLENVVFKHNQVIEVADGNYQIDGLIEFEVMGLKYKTVVECKMYKNPINRGIVQKLYSTIQSIGAHKGIIVSTSNFQSGALLYARQHGIALIQMTEAGTEYYERAFNTVMNHPFVPFNGSNPYIGVKIGTDDNGHGMTCSYLSPQSDALVDFLKSKTK